MNDRSLYNLARVLGVALMILSAMLAYAMNQPDLGLSKQGVAILGLVQTGIAVALGVLPRIQGNTRARGD